MIHLLSIEYCKKSGRSSRAAQLDASRYSIWTTQIGLVKVPDQQQTCSHPRTSRRGQQVKSLSQMSWQKGFLPCIFTQHTRFSNFTARLYALFCAAFNDGANAARLPSVIWCKCPVLCPAHSTCKFHGTVLWLYFQDGRRGSSHFTHWLLFICLCAPEFTRLQCCALRTVPVF